MSYIVFELNNYIMLSCVPHDEDVCLLTNDSFQPILLFGFMFEYIFHFVFGNPRLLVMTYISPRRRYFLCKGAAV